MNLRLPLAAVVLLFSWIAVDAAHASAIHSRQSGPWSSPETWAEGKIPAAGDRVQIRSGHRVVYDVESKQVIRGILVAGTLAFARDRDTRLEVGLIRIEARDDYSEEGFDCHHMPAAEADHSHAHGSAGASPSRLRPALEVGTPQAPIPAEHTALIRLHYIEGMDKKSCPAIVCCGGRMDFHGAPLERTWVKLPFQSARVGEAKLVMPYPLPGWKVGDRIILSGTTRQFGYLGTRYIGPNGEDNSVRDNPTTEMRTITAMRSWGRTHPDMQIVALDEPLKFDHKSIEGYRAEVANLSRNVIVESADPDGVRGHTMYHRHSTGSISYAEFRHLGKRGVLGRYPIHFHLVGDTMRGASVVGASIWDSHNRWITIHGTQYLVVRDCVGYRGVGHGFFLEDGTETYNVLDRNLAVQALRGEPLPDQVLPYDKNLGSGFWWANSLNTFTRNVAVECDADGYRFEVVATDQFDPALPILRPDGSTEMIDIRTLPFVRFEDNEAHTQRLFGLNLGGFSRGNHNKPNSDVGGVGPDFRHPFVIRDLKIWDTHWAFHAGAPCVIVKGADFHDCFYGFWRCVMHRHEYRDVSLSNVDTPVFFPRAVGEADYDYSIREYFDLEATDDLPPTTVITRVEAVSPDTLRVRGVASDNNEIKGVAVNGRPARATRANFAQWEIELPLPPAGELALTARAEDAAGNVEPRPHRRAWRDKVAGTLGVPDRRAANFPDSATGRRGQAEGEGDGAPSRKDAKTR